MGIFDAQSAEINLLEALMLFCMQKINFITHFFLKILQINSKLVILNNLGDAWPHTSKMILSVWRNLWCLSARKKSNSSFKYSLRCCKDTANLLFWALWTCLATHKQSDTINLQETFVFIYKQKINFIHSFFWRHCKDM